MAASIAILIYLEIPRVAFERQRDKEALLIDRGEQYARAIELYTRKTGHYPQTMDELEQGQTIRFLRRRYKDPMTGKDEWRLIHTNANGQYLDSKVHKAEGPGTGQSSGPSVLASQIQGIGQSATVISQGPQTSAALQKRASDRISPGSPGATSGDASQAGSPEGTPDASQNTDQQQNTGTAAGQNAAGSGNQSGAPVFPSVLPATQGQTQQQQSSGANASAQASGSSQSPAIQTIQSMLGANRNLPSGAAGMSPLGGGLVGVATTVEMEGIRRYKDHSNYSEWEFVYDPRDTQTQGQGGNGQQGANSAGANAANSAFGGMSGGTAAPASGGPH